MSNKLIIKDIKTKEDVAMLLQISVLKLNIIIGHHRVESYYTEFKIPKKSGGFRLITSPKGDIKIIQKKLAVIFSNLYYEFVMRNDIAHGFVPCKSIKSNAVIHVGSDFLLNIDIKDFFPSISFSRVRGLLIKAFNIGPEAAKIISLLVCYKGTLPQGSPCSPIISNMICKRLDSDLFKLSRKYRLKISRYADDITISCNDQSNFNNVFHYGDITEELTKVIENNGFTVNDEKVRASLLR